MRLGLVFVLVLAGCSTKSLLMGLGGPECADPGESVGLSEPTALGFSAQDLFGASLGAVGEVQITWVDASMTAFSGTAEEVMQHEAFVVEASVTTASMVLGAAPGSICPAGDEYLRALATVTIASDDEALVGRGTIAVVGSALDRWVYGPEGESPFDTAVAPHLGATAAAEAAAYLGEPEVDVGFRMWFAANATGPTVANFLEFDLDLGSDGGDAVTGLVQGSW